MIALNKVILVTNNFPDGTFRINFNKSEYKMTPTDNVITWTYEKESELNKLIFLKKHLDSLNYKDTILQLPYIPNARQDRVKDEEDVFTLKYFCEIINFLNFKEVQVLDAHSNVSTALLNKVVNYSSAPYISSALQAINKLNGIDNLIAFYPDEGAMKRYSDLLSLPYNFGIKKRDWKTGQILGLDVIENVITEGKDILIIDDICSKGGTFYHSAKKLKELGANHIYLFATHCEKNIFFGEIFKSNIIDKVFTTNSIFTKNVQEEMKNYNGADKIIVFPV